MPISLKANSDGSAEILNGVVRALKINTDGSLEGTTIDGKLNRSENINLGVSVAASGTAIAFTGIPEGVKRVTILFDGVSTNGSSGLTAALGTDAWDNTLTYNGNIMILNGSSPACVGLPSAGNITLESFTGSRTAASTRYGKCVLERLSGNTWIISSRLAETGTSIVDMYVGSKTLSGELGRIYVAPTNGTDQFDAGIINISWEF